MSTKKVTILFDQMKAALIGPRLPKEMMDSLKTQRITPDLPFQLSTESQAALRQRLKSIVLTENQTDSIANAFQGPYAVEWLPVTNMPSTVVAKNGNPSAKYLPEPKR